MSSNSIFDLKEEESQLASKNEGCINLKYQSIPATRNVNSTTFSGGTISFKFNVDGTTWWNPSKSFVMAESTLTDENGAQLTVADNIGYSMNTLMNLFSSAELRVNDKTIEKIENNVPQIAALKNRNKKSGAWLKSIAKGTNNWIPSLNERINLTASDGISAITGVISGTTDWAFIQDDNASQNMPNAGSDVYLTFGATGALTTSSGTFATRIPSGTYQNAGLRILKTGKYTVSVKMSMDSFQLADTWGTLFLRTTVDGSTVINVNGQAVGNALEIQGGMRATDNSVSITWTGTLTVGGGGYIDILLNYRNDSVTSQPSIQISDKYISIVEVGVNGGSVSGIASRRITGEQLIAQPPLSVFDLDHALPCGEYELVLTPYNDYKKKGIESSGADKTAGTDYLFDINKIEFVVNTVEGPRVSDKEYLIDLKVMSCQSQKCDANTAQQIKVFDVPPSTMGIDIAFQSSLNGTNTLWSPSKFRTQSDIERSLNFLLLSYANQTCPPDGPYEPAYTANGADNRGKLYNIHQLNTGGFFDPAGSEEYNEWANENGLLLHSVFVKDGTNTDSRAKITYKFGTSPANTNVILFTESYRTVRVKVMNGRVVDIRVIED